MDEKKLETEMGLKTELPKSVKTLGDALKAHRAAEPNHGELPAPDPLPYAPPFKASPAAPPTTAPPEASPAHPSHPYHHLMHILKLAFDQSATGKGKARHASSPVGDRRWVDQPILTNSRQLGPAAPAFQVMKKAQEAVTMAGNHNYDAAMAEMLGAIVYAAATYQLLSEMKAANAPK